METEEKDYQSTLMRLKNLVKLNNDNDDDFGEKNDFNNNSEFNNQFSDNNVSDHSNSFQNNIISNKILDPLKSNQQQRSPSNHNFLNIEENTTNSFKDKYNKTNYDRIQNSQNEQIKFNKYSSYNDNYSFSKKEIPYKSSNREKHEQSLYEKDYNNSFESSNKDITNNYQSDAHFSSNQNFYKIKNMLSNPDNQERTSSSKLKKKHSKHRNLRKKSYNSSEENESNTDSEISSDHQHSKQYKEYFSKTKSKYRLKHINKNYNDDSSDEYRSYNGNYQKDFQEQQYVNRSYHKKIPQEDFQRNQPKSQNYIEKDRFYSNEQYYQNDIQSELSNNKRNDLQVENDKNLMKQLELQNNEINELKNLIKQMFPMNQNNNGQINERESINNINNNSNNSFTYLQKTNIQQPEYAIEPYDFGNLDNKAVVRRLQSYPTVVRGEYEPHPSLNNITEEEAQNIRDINEIYVTPPEGVYTPKPISSFKLGTFPDYINAYIDQMNFNNPTPIQMQSWPIIQQGFDLLGIAATGSGKTLAFLIPAFLHIIRQEPLRPNDGPICLVLSPTRELAQQISKVINELCLLNKSTKDQIVKVHCSYGGMKTPLNQEYSMHIGGKADIIVASPGRLLALLERTKLDLNRVSFLVIDEVDCLFSNDFSQLTTYIAKNTSQERQTLMFSATWSSEVESIKNLTSLNACFCVSIGDIDPTQPDLVKSIEQVIYTSNEGQISFNKKLKVIENELLNIKKQCLVFCDTRKDVNFLYDKLSFSFKNFKIGYIHGGLDQNIRNLTLASFRKQNTTILITTDLLSRGIDIPNIGLVINYSCPKSLEIYTHRTGRTGRAGRKGKSITFIDSYRNYFIEVIKSHFKNTIINHI